MIPHDHVSCKYRCLQEELIALVVQAVAHGRCSHAQHIQEYPYVPAYNVRHLQNRQREATYQCLDQR